MAVLTVVMNGFKDKSLWFKCFPVAVDVNHVAIAFVAFLTIFSDTRHFLARLDLIDKFVVIIVVLRGV